MTTPNLIQEATAARDHAVAPFSKFKVGAALVTKAGKVYRGCNVENCTYGDVDVTLATWAGSASSTSSPTSSPTHSHSV